MRVGLLVKRERNGKKSRHYKNARIVRLEMYSGNINVSNEVKDKIVKNTGNKTSTASILLPF